MPVIDDLQIRIQGDAVKANDAIDKLVGKLDRLSTALSGLSGKNLSSLSTGVTRLSGAMTAMNNVKTADFTRLATNITKLANLDSGRIGQAAGAMHQFVNSLESLNNAKISYKAQQIAELSKGIAKLGYKSSTKAIENIPQLAQGMAHLMTTLSKAPKVSQNLIDMTNALAKLSRTGSSSGKAANSLSSALNKYTTSTTRAKKGTFSLASAIGKLYATYWLLIRAFGKIKDAIDISSQLTEVQNVVDVTFGKYSNLVDKMSEISINEFGMSELTVKQVASRFQAMGTAMGFAQGEMADMSIELTKLTADMASFYNVEQDAVAEDLASIFTGSTRPLRQYGLDLTYATLQEWALKQGIDANVKSMSQAEKTMLRYQYVLANTGAAQGDFLRTADTWANQTRILKQNFQQLGAVIGGTFINALKPMVKALNSAMSHIIAFAKTVSNALGKIFGWTYEEGGGGIANDMEYAADSSEDLAGGLSNAEKNAKKLKSHLLGIDELNVLEPDTGDSSSGSGGGAGGTGGASADGGQWVKTDSIFKNFESEIDTLEKLGNTIRDSLIKAMESIEWQKIYEKARGFGSGLAEFLNGLLDYDKEGRTLFGEIGKTFANTLNTIVYAAQSFLTDFDFYQFGVNLADGINRFFENFDFIGLADSLNKFVDGLKETIAGFLETLTFEKIISTIDGFLDELELDTVAVTIGAFTIKNKSINKLLATAITAKIGSGITLSAVPLMLKSFAIPGTPGFDVIGEQILTWIETGIEKLLPDWAQRMIGNIVLGMSTGGIAGSVIPGIGTLAGAIIGALSGAFLTEVNGSNILEKLLQPIFNWDRTMKVFEDMRTNFKEGGWNIVIGIAEGILGALSFLIEPFADLFDFVVETFCDIFGIHSPAETMKPLGKNIILGVIEGFSLAYNELKRKLEEIWDVIREKFEGIRSTVSEKIVDVKNNVTEKFENIRRTISEKVTSAKTTVTTKFEEIKKTISDKVTEAKTNVTTAFENIKKTISDKIDLIKTKLSGFKDAIDNVIKKIKEFFGFDGERLSIGLPTSAFDSFKEKVSSVIQKLRDFLSFDGKSVSVSATTHYSESGREHDGGGRGFATGGFPEPATYFWAGENGVPEILGTVGGRTAVAGGAEITGIREAVYDVGQNETALLQMAVSLLEVIASKDTSVNIDGRTLVSAYDERKARNGFSFT